MRWMRWASIGGVVSSLLLASNAFASPTVLAPPGHAGANQYFETIPTSAGNAAPPGSVTGSGSANAGPHALAGLGNGASTDGRLAQLGKPGQAAAALAASTAPTPARSAASGSTSSGGSIGTGLAHVLSGSESGGLGIAFPLLLATALVAACGIAGVTLVRLKTHRTR